ncbi:unnamed protein product [Chrysodeixis includens]|uniref:Uncharacterized protein n=1 Tax=Chrysodeixis includens TaxID=689277 RepID=A0A9N8PYS9_CHRIL|nr:unnamed protein product [Chrysodeixis includens]
MPCPMTGIVILFGFMWNLNINRPSYIISMVGLKATLSQPPSPGSYLPELSSTVIGIGPGAFSRKVTYHMHVGLPTFFKGIEKIILSPHLTDPKSTAFTFDTR